jgi:hypothetical protein
LTEPARGHSRTNSDSESHWTRKPEASLRPESAMPTGTARWQPSRLPRCRRPGPATTGWPAGAGRGPGPAAPQARELEPCGPSMFQVRRAATSEGCLTARRGAANCQWARAESRSGSASHRDRDWPRAAVQESCHWQVTAGRRRPWRHCPPPPRRLPRSSKA